MKKLLRLLICASLVFTFHLSPFTLNAQITHTSAGQVDRGADEVMKKAVKKLGNVSLKVKMTATDSEKKTVSEGKADVMYNGSQYRIVMDNQEVVCDGKTVWHWNKEANEVAINEVAPDDDMNLLNPSLLIAHYSKNFKAKLIRIEDDGTAVVDLQPYKGQSYHKIRLFIVEKSGELRRLEVHKYDSSRELYEFSKHRYNSVKGTLTFDPKAHPGIEIIDMR
jgi:outer membrane lipoprotein-sorting protein